MSSTVWSYKNPSEVARAVKRIDPVIEFFSSTGPVRSTLGGINQSVANFQNTINGTNSQALSRIDDNVYKKLKYQYANLYVATGAGLITSGISNVSSGITGTLDQASDAIADALKPVSSFMGATLYSLTNVMKDPLGSVFDLPNTIGPILDAISPTLRAKFQATYKNHNLGKMFELPGQIFGSIQSLVSTIDGILAIPVQLLSDIYAGLMEVMKMISDLINSALDSVQKFLISIIDNLLPGLTDFLSQLSNFAGQIGGLASIFAGANAITSFTNNILTFSNTLNGVLQSPLDYAFAMMPPSVSQGLYVLQNPQQLLNQALAQVPQVGNILGQISSVTGFGLNGNMGYGLHSVLQGLQGGVLASIFNGFARQFSILAPLFTGGFDQGAAPGGSNSTVPFAAGSTTYDKGIYGANIVQTEPNQPNPTYVGGP
jgi:hypothetical protein